MTELGKFSFDPSRDGGVLYLAGLDEELRVFAGPRGNVENGAIVIYGAGKQLARLQASGAADQGRLVLYGRCGGTALDRNPIWVLNAGAGLGRGPFEAAYGFLSLRAAPSANAGVYDIVRLRPYSMDLQEIDNGVVEVLHSGKQRGALYSNADGNGEFQLYDEDGRKVHLWVTSDKRGRLNLAGDGPGALVRLDTEDHAGSLGLWADVGPLRQVAALEGDTHSANRKLGALRLYDTKTYHTRALVDRPQFPQVQVQATDRGGSVLLHPPDREEPATTLMPGHVTFQTPGVPIAEDPLFARIAANLETRRAYLQLQGEDAAGVVQNVVIDIDGIRCSGGKTDRFVAEHPRDPTQEISYYVQEGPEVGVYLRGRAHLAEGRARVSLPEHFGDVASPDGLTVQLTPRSAASLGVAATSLSTSEIVIEELFEGRGEYDVDYVVHGVRKGYEAYPVVQPKRHPLPVPGSGQKPSPRGSA